MRCRAAACCGAAERKDHEMSKVYLAIEIDERGEPQRRSETPKQMTPEQQETYDSLYANYKAVQRAWDHWFDLFSRFHLVNPRIKEAARKEAIWQQSADHTTRLLEQSDPKLKAVN
jgi:hypothetical protein